MALSTRTVSRAASFDDSIGVCVHAARTTGPYGAVPLIQQDLAYLGVGNIREDFDPNSEMIAKYRAIDSFVLGGTSYTIKSDLIGSGDGVQTTLDFADQLAPYLSAIEGPNEVNEVPITFTTGSGVVLGGAAAAYAYQQQLYASVKADPLLAGVAVYSFSLGYDGVDVPTGYGDVSPYCDAVSVHVYGSGQPISYLAARSRMFTQAPGRPDVITETGNYVVPDKAGVTEGVQAKLEVNTFLDAYAMGVQHTYCYDLFDDRSDDPSDPDPENHYGLFNYDGSAKQAAVAIHDLTAILSDTAANASAFATTSLACDLSGTGGNDSSLLLEKSDGTYELALWMEVSIWDSASLSEVAIRPHDVTATFAAVYQTINVYDVLAGTAPVATYHNVNGVQVPLGSSALVVELVPAPAAVPAATGTSVLAAGTAVAASGADATVTVTGAANVVGSSGAMVVNLTGSGASVSGGTGALIVNGQGGGGNTVVGGSGTFTYVATAGGDTVTTGTSASNTVVLGSGDGFVTTLAAATVTGGSGSGTVALLAAGASVVGGSGALTVDDQAGGATVAGGSGAFGIHARNGGNVITTGTSSDNRVWLYGTGGDTVTVLGTVALTGGPGSAAVRLAGGVGSSFVQAGAGAMAVTDDGAGGNFIQGGSGALSVTDNGGDAVVGGSGAITVASSQGGETIVTNNTGGTSLVSLGYGYDTVVANGATSIRGGAASLLVSGTGSVSVDGGLTGSMTVNGGTGSDWVFTQANTRNVVNLGSGTGTVLSHGLDTISASAAAGAASELIYVGTAATVIGGAAALLVIGDGRVLLTGGTGAVTGTFNGSSSFVLGGTAGGNTLTASGSNITLVGGGAGDVLSDTGTAGGNVLLASTNGTTLMAGSGNDTLAGSIGPDVFVLTGAAAPHATVIQGYTRGTDALSFTGFGSAKPIASQQVVGTNLQLTLADRSTVTLVGVSAI